MFYTSRADLQKYAIKHILNCLKKISFPLNAVIAAG